MGKFEDLKDFYKRGYRFGATNEDRDYLIAEVESLRSDIGQLREALKNERITSAHKNDEIERLRKIEDEVKSLCRGSPYNQHWMSYLQDALK